MKKILYICAAVLGLSSCEKFFEREPEDKFAANMFFKTETDLQSYTNGLIDSAIPDADDIALGSDTYTDFCGTKDSKQFFSLTGILPPLLPGGLIPTGVFSVRLPTC